MKELELKQTAIPNEMTLNLMEHYAGDNCEGFLILLTTNSSDENSTEYHREFVLSNCILVQVCDQRVNGFTEKIIAELKELELKQTAIPNEMTLNLMEHYDFKWVANMVPDLYRTVFFTIAEILKHYKSKNENPRVGFILKDR